jgi:PAS domain S-box-containing protein
METKMHNKIQIQVPDTKLEDWQEIVDILAQLFEIPAALVMRLQEPHIEVFVSSRSKGNPYHPGDRETVWGSGLYCERVIQSRDKLLVPNALKDERWKENPDIKWNMISYLGFPILLPDGTPFGTICVLDSKENAYSDVFERLMQKFQRMIQSDLEIIDANQRLGEKNRELMDDLSETSVNIYKTIVSSIPEPMAVIDENNTYVMVNPGFERFWNLDKTGIIGKHVQDIIGTKEYKEIVKERAERCLKGESVSYGIWLHSPALGRRFVQIHYHPYGTVPGEIAGRIAIGYDMTEHKQVEQALRDKEERFRRIIENTNAGYFFIDKQGNFQQVNQAWLNIHGYDSADEVIGRPYTLTQAPADLNGAGQNVERLLSGKTIATGEFTRRCRDGSIGYHSFSAHPVVQDGEVMGLEGFIIDTNERKRADEQSHQLRKAESLSRMAGAVAHHFNNQLTVVLGNLEMALEDLQEAPGIRNCLLAALKAAKRSSEISGLMLTYIGQGIDKSEALDLSRLVRRHLPMVQALIPKDIVLETDVMSSGPIVFANANQVRMALNHLITNSVEAMGGRNGRVRLSVRTLPAADIPGGLLAPTTWKPVDGDYACLKVEDTGCGVTPLEMPKLFDPFFTTKFTGRGLGLSVVLGLVKVWRGAVRVESIKDQGSTFCILLPVFNEAPSGASDTAAGSQEADYSGLVLMVDDQEPVRKMGETLLSRLGFSILSAAAGAEALGLFRRHPGEVCCVITDLTMPGMDGWELLAALRRIQPGLPVILASGYEEALAMGRDAPEQPNAFLHKPYSKADLKTALNRALMDGRGTAS